jgi:tetrahydromethanopterin S-methyltransferase subunit C
MYILILPSLILGTILGRFYKFPILIPVYVLAIVSVLVRSGLDHFSLTAVVAELIVFVVCIQIGYITGILARQIPRLRGPWFGKPVAEHCSNGLSSTTIKIKTQRKYLK